MSVKYPSLITIVHLSVVLSSEEVVLKNNNKNPGEFSSQPIERHSGVHETAGTLCMQDRGLRRTSYLVTQNTEKTYIQGSRVTKTNHLHCLVKDTYYEHIMMKNVRDDLYSSIPLPWFGLRHQRTNSPLLLHPPYKYGKSRYNVKTVLTSWIIGKGLPWVIRPNVKTTNLDNSKTRNSPTALILRWLFLPSTEIKQLKTRAVTHTTCGLVPKIYSCFN